MSTKILQARPLGGYGLGVALPPNCVGGAGERVDPFRAWARLGGMGRNVVSVGSDLFGCSSVVPTRGCG